MGRRDAWKDHIGIFLHYESEEPVVINFQISLVPASLQCTSGALCSSNLKMEGHFKTGWDDFIGRAELSEFLTKDDTLSVECEVECLSDWRASLVPDLEPAVSDEIGCATDFAQLLTMSPEESFSDFTFEIGGKLVHAHKAILAARSPVFRTMLATNMVESRSGRVKLDDVELPVFNAMMRYLYSGRIDEDLLASKCEEVLALADRYDVRKLKERCEVLLSKAISLDTVVNLLSVAETYHATSLKSIALLYAGQHFLELIHTDSFKELGLRTPSLMVEIQESFAHYNGIRKRATTAIPDDEPKKRQYRAPK